MYNRHEMVDIVKIDGKARGVIVRNLLTGEFSRHFGHAVVLATGGYGNVYYLSTNAMGSTLRQPGKHIKREPLFLTPVLHKFTLRVFQCLETTSLN